MNSEISQPVHPETAQSVRKEGVGRTSSSGQKPLLTTGNGFNQKTLFQPTGVSMEAAMDDFDLVDKKASGVSVSHRSRSTTENKTELQRRSAGSASSKEDPTKVSSLPNRNVCDDHLSVEPSSTSSDLLETTNSSDKRDFVSAKVRDVLMFCDEMQLNSREKRQIVSSFGVKKRNSRKMNKNDVNRQRTLGPYIKFCAEWREILKNENPHWTATELVKNLGASWQRLKREDRRLLETRFGLKPESAS